MRYNQIAVVGATGAVGKELLLLLEQTTAFEYNAVRCFASERSVGKTIKFRGEELGVELLTEESFRGIDIAFFSAGSSRSKDFAPHAVKAGCIVIDNSSAFRMTEEVPLVVPEVNPEDISKHSGIIANPNCSTIIMLMALAPIHRINRLRRVVGITYQAVSGAGMKGIDELQRQLIQFQEGKPLTNEIFSYPIANNLFSHDTPIGEDGYNEEERKMIRETRKILHLPALPITTTCVRVPIFRAHSIALHLELTSDVDLDAIRGALQDFPGVKVVDDIEGDHFPMPLEATGKHEVLIGRVRKDEAFENGIALFVCGDQILKGAALNAIQILEHLNG
jgi:aspartate-semialdehyde dehydrogenase